MKTAMHFHSVTFNWGMNFVEINEKLCKNQFLTSLTIFDTAKKNI